MKLILHFYLILVNRPPPPPPPPPLFISGLSMNLLLRLLPLLDFLLLLLPPATQGGTRLLFVRLLLLQQQIRVYALQARQPVVVGLKGISEVIHLPVNKSTHASNRYQKTMHKWADSGCVVISSLRTRGRHLCRSVFSVCEISSESLAWSISRGFSCVWAWVLVWVWVCMCA